MIAITPGEPAGIGADICLALAHRDDGIQKVFICDPELLRQRAKGLGSSVEIKTFSQLEDITPDALDAKRVNVLSVRLAEQAKSGVLSIRNAAYVVETLRLAAQGCLSGKFSAVVTGPVQKSVINDAGIAFSGHTEYFAEQSKVDKVVMMLASKAMRVALVTTHLPLRDVANAITDEELTRTFDILAHDLNEKFGITQPQILVCGLNPHAGENGHLGSEEIDTIIPAMTKFNANNPYGATLIGPLPADTLFVEKNLSGKDAILAMYHDQGLPVLKHASFGEAINITLGLPFIRTSVDHGTALDLAGTGQADPGSLFVAVDQAATLVKSGRL